MKNDLIAVGFSDLAQEYQDSRKKINAAVLRVLKSGWYILGREVEAFEREFAQYCGVKYSLGCASGTEALALSLMSLGIGKNDEVITVSNTAVPTISAISMSGARPILVDIDDYYHIDPRLIEKAITKKTKAIIPVHLYGQVAEMDRIMDIAKRHNLFVVEDACQAHGAKYKNKKAGSFGHLGCFSFYPTKNLGCFGDGGAITTDDAQLYRKLVMLRNYGQANRYHHVIKGINSRLDEVQAAVLRLKLKYLDKFNEQRRSVAKFYNELLSDICLIPEVRKQSYHIYHLYVIRVKQRDGLRSYLKQKGIDTLIHYPVPVHLQLAYKDLKYKKGSLPLTEKITQEIISLPIYPGISRKKIKYAASMICSFIQAE